MSSQCFWTFPQWIQLWVLLWSRIWTEGIKKASVWPKRGVGQQKAHMFRYILFKKSLSLSASLFPFLPSFSTTSSMCGDLRPTCRSWFSPYVWVPEMKFRLWGLAASAFPCRAILLAPCDILWISLQDRRYWTSLWLGYPKTPRIVQCLHLCMAPLFQLWNVMLPLSPRTV